MPRSVRLRLRPVSGPARRREAGFTLIEMMVVLVIIGIGASAVGLKVAGNPGRALRQEAQLLTQRFIAAQSESRLDGRTIRWQADSAGYRFVRPAILQPEDRIAPVLSRQKMDDFDRDDMLRPRPWLAGPVQVQPRDGVVFGPEPVSAPWALALSDGSVTITLRRDAAGRFSYE